MQDPYYARIIFQIESHIHDYDLKVHAREGIDLRDSDIKSALRKALSLLRGSGPPRSPKNQQDRLKGALAIELAGIYEHEQETEGVSGAEFIKALLAAEDTLKLRREMAGHSRGYLEFLKEFIPEARGNQPNPKDRYRA